MPSPSELERLEGWGQLAARDALQVQVREQSCPALPDHGPNPLWPEIQALTKERDALRRRLHEQALATQEAHEHVEREIAASLAHQGIDVTERLGQHPVWQLVASVVSVLVCERDELKSQLATAKALAADWQREANTMRERIGKAFAPPPYVGPARPRPHHDDDGA